MGFWKSLTSMDLQEFRPGVRSTAELGDTLVMATMEIGPGKEDSGHAHPFEQCGVVIEGAIEMFIGEEKRVLEPMDAYFIPAGVLHGWKTSEGPVKIFDVCGKAK
jgi:quercetin dioxygenase-like cupin family protein